MALSSNGIIDGISGTLVVILGVVFALFFYSEGKKKNSKMLKELAFVNLFSGLLYIGVLLDFVWILVTGENFLGISDVSNFWVPLSSYIWFPPLVVVAIHLATSVEYPKQAKWAALAYAIVGVIFYYRMLFPQWTSLNPLLSFDITYYEPSGLLDYNLRMSSGAGIWLILMLALVIVVFCFGLIYNSSKTSGALKKRFVFMAVGALCFGISGMAEGFIGGLGILIIIVRGAYSVSFLIVYFGLKAIEAK